MFPVNSAKTGLASYDRAPGSGNDARNLAIEGFRVDAKPRVDVVADMPSVGMASEFTGVTRPGIPRIEILDVALSQSFQAKRHIAAGEVFDDTVEAPPALGVVPWLAHQRQPLRVHQCVEFWARRVEQWQPGEIFGGGGIGM